MRRIILDRFGKCRAASAFFFVSSKYRIVYSWRMYRTLTVLGMEERRVGAAS